MADHPMQELLTCSICLDRFTNPKVLPCIHTFCLNCLRRIAGNAASVSCPTCREEHAIPDHDVAKFKENYVLNNLLAMFEAGAGIDIQVQPKATKECSDCQRKISLSKCRHCSEMICADCRASHVELSCDIKYFLNTTENATTDDAPAEGDRIWKELLDRIVNEQKRLPLLFEQLQKKVAQRKEEITLYFDLMKKRLERLVRDEDTPLQQSVQQRVTECKTSSALRGLKYLLDSTEATLASVLQSEGREKFVLSLESGVETMGHIVHGGKTIEIVGAGGSTFPSIVKPESSLPVRHKRSAQPGQVGYQDKNKRFRKLYTHPVQGVLRPLYALYSEYTDSLYCISEGPADGKGQVLVFSMDDDDGRVLSPLLQQAHHLALTNSGKLMIAETASVAIVDLCDRSSNFNRIVFPAITFLSQICARGNDLVILDPEKKRIYIYDEDYQLLHEIEVKAKIDRNSKMAVNGDQIYITGSDATVADRKDCGEEKGCPKGHHKKPASVKVTVRVPIFVFSQTGDEGLFNIDTSVVCDYAYNVECGGCYDNMRNDASASNEDVLKKFMVQSLCVDREGYVCITTRGDRQQRVLVYTPDDEFHCEIGAPETDQATFKDPRGVALMPDGRLIVCDYGQRRIQLI